MTGNQLHLHTPCAPRHTNKTMSVKPKALIGFSRMKDDELVVAANTILGAMTDNAHFPAPTPGLGDIQGLLDDFTAKLATARKRGSPEDTARKDEAKPLLADALQKLGYYVNTVAKGQLSTLLSSGFPTNATGSVGMIPSMVENVKLRDGRQSGQIRLDFASQQGVRVYEYRYRRSDDPEAKWSDRFTTTSSRANVIAPLDIGVFYEFQVRAINTHGTGDWSNTARILVR